MRLTLQRTTGFRRKQEIFVLYTAEVGVCATENHYAQCKMTDSEQNAHVVFVSNLTSRKTRTSSFWRFNSITLSS